MSTIYGITKDNNKIQTTNHGHVIFLQDSDINVEFKNEFILDFNKFNITGLINVNNFIYTGSSGKVKIDINMVYQWINMDYAPRYDIVIFKNDVVDKRRSFGMMDSYIDENVNDLFFVINIKNNDKIQIKMLKHNGEVNMLRIEENSYYEISVFWKIKKRLIIF